MTKRQRDHWATNVLSLRDRIDFRNASTWRRLMTECRKLNKKVASELIGDCHTSKKRATIAMVFQICVTFNPGLLKQVSGCLMMEYRLSEHELHEVILTNIFTSTCLCSKSLSYVLVHLKSKDRDLHTLSVKILYQALYRRSIVTTPALRKIRSMRGTIEKHVETLRSRKRKSPKKSSS